jgi:hypothetical protein
MFLSPQFLSVRMVIREEFQKSYKRIENISKIIRQLRIKQNSITFYLKNIEQKSFLF